MVSEIQSKILLIQLQPRVGNKTKADSGANTTKADTANGLSCYLCDKCEVGSDTPIEKCSENQNACMKMAEDQGLAEADKFAGRHCMENQEGLPTDGTCHDIVTNGGKTVIACLCATDLCNGGPASPLYDKLNGKIETNRTTGQETQINFFARHFTSRQAKAVKEKANKTKVDSGANKTEADSGANQTEADVAANQTEADVAANQTEAEPSQETPIKMSGFRSFTAQVVINEKGNNTKVEVDSGANKTEADAAANQTEAEPGQETPINMLVVVEEKGNKTKADSGANITKADSGANKTEADSGANKAQVELEEKGNKTKEDSGANKTEPDSGANKTEAEPGQTPIKMSGLFLRQLQSVLEGKRYKTLADSGANKTEADSGANKTEVDSGANQTGVDSGANQTEADTAANQTETDPGQETPIKMSGFRSFTAQAVLEEKGNKTKKDSGANKTEADSGANKTEADSGPNKTEVGSAANQTEAEPDDTTVVTEASIPDTLESRNMAPPPEPEPPKPNPNPAPKNPDPESQKKKQEAVKADPKGLNNSNKLSHIPCHLFLAALLTPFLM